MKLTFLIDVLIADFLRTSLNNVRIAGKRIFCQLFKKYTKIRPTTISITNKIHRFFLSLILDNFSPNCATNAANTPDIAFILALLFEIN